MVNSAQNRVRKDFTDFTELDIQESAWTTKDDKEGKFFLVKGSSVFKSVKRVNRHGMIVGHVSRVWGWEWRVMMGDDVRSVERCWIVKTLIYLANRPRVLNDCLAFPFYNLQDP